MAEHCPGLRLPTLPPWAVNIALFQVGWWGVVLAAASGQAVWGVLLVALLAVVHLQRTGWQAREFQLLLAVALIGLAYDSLLSWLGWVSYAGSAPGSLAPLWMVALWVNFALTLNGALAPLAQRPGLAALLGALGGPLAYWAGAGLGAMTFLEPLPALLFLGFGWAMLTPALLVLARALHQGETP